MLKSVVMSNQTSVLARSFLVVLGVSFFFSCLEFSVRAATVTVDPTTVLTNYWSGGEWNVDGDLEGWSTAQITNAVVAGGTLTGSASGTDSQLSRLAFAGGADLDLGFNDYLDIRLQLPADYLGDVQILMTKPLCRAVVPLPRLGTA